MSKATARNALQSALVATGLACAIHAGATSVTISISGGLVQAESGDPLPAGSMLQLINLGPNGVFDPIPAGSWTGGDDSVVTLPFASGEANHDGYATAACFDLTDGLDTPGTFDRVFTLELGGTLRAGDRLGMRWFAGVPASNGFGPAPPAPGTPYGQFTRQEDPLHGGMVWIVPAAASVVTFDSFVTTSFGGLDPENPGLANGANLSNLELSASTLAPAFAMATTTYSASVSNATISMTVTPIVADSAATVEVNSMTVASGTPSGAINLNVGANIVTILVTGSNGTTTKTYSLVVKRQSPIESWRQTWFGTPSNAGNAADNADPYRTGIPNLKVFAFFGPNQDPAQAALGRLPQAQRTGDNVFFSFTQPAGVSGITYGAERSTTLAPGSWQPVTDTGSGSVHTFSVSIESKTRLFMRLQVANP